MQAYQSGDWGTARALLEACLSEGIKQVCGGAGGGREGRGCVCGGGVCLLGACLGVHTAALQHL